MYLDDSNRNATHGAEMRPTKKTYMDLGTSFVMVGVPEDFHVGGHLISAARGLAWAATVVDVRDAWSTNRIVNSLCFRLLGRRPPFLKRFSMDVVDQTNAVDAQWLLATGVAPIRAKELRQLRQQGIKTACFLTDDPWNPANGADFFWDSLREYDLIATPRFATITELVQHGCRSVKYVPFAYNPAYHFVESSTPEEDCRYRCDVAILGGADTDRVKLAEALAASGLDLALYGGYWDCYRHLRQFSRGHVHGRELRLAVRLAGSQVCMVRRANRDGHAMRTYEFPAMGAVPVLEDTPEHRQLFVGEEFVDSFWSDPSSLVKACTRVSKDRACAASLREAAQRIVIGAPANEPANTYAARLKMIRSELI